MPNDPQALEFLDSAIETIDAGNGFVRPLCGQKLPGLTADLAAVWKSYRPPARTFREALQSLRLLPGWSSGWAEITMSAWDASTVYGIILKYPPCKRPR